MKRIIILQMMIMMGLFSMGQSTASQGNWGGTGKAYIPYHQFLQQQYAGLQNSGIGSRGLVYKQISYRQDSWDVNKEAYTASDSGTFAYTNQGWATSYTRYVFTQGLWGGYYKLTYTYDGTGNQVSYLNQFWDNNSDSWINVTQVSNTYDGNGHMLTALSQTWNSEATGWLNVQNFNYAYDSHGNQVQQTLQNWNASNNSWSNVSQTLNSYDANNRLTSTISRQGASGGWANTAQTLNTYDNSGNLLTQTAQTWSNGAWVNYSLLTNTYNGANRLTSSLSQAWNGTWLNYALVNNTYDANNNQISQGGYNWDLKSNAWDSTTLNIYTYNAANKILTETDQVNGYAGFTNAYQYVYSYDGNNNNTQYESFQNMSGAWTPMAMYQYSYDENNNPVYEQYQAYSLQTSTFESQNQYNFYYQSFEVPTAIGAVNRNDFGATIYPNPSTGAETYVNLTVDANANIVMNVYDLNGRMINTGFMPLESGSQKIQLSSSDLANGTYYVQLIDRDGGKTSVLPFVKQ